MSKIEWTDASWNPTCGCSKVSPGCKLCYAMRAVHRMAANPNVKLRDRFEGLTQIVNGKPEWTGVVRLAEDMLEVPLRWRQPRKIFVNSLSDLFHEDLTIREIARVFCVMAEADWHTFQILTKRAARLPGALADIKRMVGYEWPLRNVQIGVSAENQEAADERVVYLDDLKALKLAAVTFVSYEPALGPINFWKNAPGTRTPLLSCVDWVIVGGESGRGARPFDTQWARDVIQQCKTAGVAVFCKQLGANPRYHTCRNPECTHPDCGYVSLDLKDRKGGDWSEWPKDLRVREFPREAVR